MVWVLLLNQTPRLPATGHSLDLLVETGIYGAAGIREELNYNVSRTIEFASARGAK